MLRISRFNLRHSIRAAAMLAAFWTAPALADPCAAPLPAKGSAFSGVVRYVDFANGAFEAADPMPDWLLPLRERAARFAGLAAADLAQALVIRYDPGAGIGWHRDRPVFEHVVGVSLGAPAIMRFRRRCGAKFGRASAPLETRSVYHMRGEARHDWEHSIVEMDRPRWSVAFRSLSA